MLIDTSRPIACVAAAPLTRSATSSRLRSRTALPSNSRWSFISRSPPQPRPVIEARECMPGRSLAGSHVLDHAFAAGIGAALHPALVQQLRDAVANGLQVHAGPIEQRRRQ